MKIATGGTTLAWSGMVSRTNDSLRYRDSWHQVVWCDRDKSPAVFEHSCSRGAAGQDDQEDEETGQAGVSV